MPFGLTRSKGKDTSSQLTNYSTKTSGPAIAQSYKGGTGTYAEKGGRAAAVSRHGSGWSKSVAYGGDVDYNKHSSREVSKAEHYSYTSGNATAGVIEGGTFAQAGKGGYGEAVYRNGDRFSVSVAYGEGRKGGAGKLSKGGLVPLRTSSNERRMIELAYCSSDDEGEDSDA